MSTDQSKHNKHGSNVSQVSQIKSNVSVAQPKTQCWYEWKSTSKNIPNRSYQISAVYQGYLYIYGGYDLSTGTLNDFYRTSLSGNERKIQWQKLEIPDSPGPLYKSASIVYSNKLYIFGGLKTSTQDTNDLYIYDFDSQSWSLQETTNTPTALNSHCMACFQNQLIVFSGYLQNSAKYNQQLLSLNLDTFEWTILFDMSEGEEQIKQTSDRKFPMPRCGSAAVIIKNELYIFGGNQSDLKLNDFWKFDLNTNQWKEIPSNDKTPLSRTGHSLNEYNGKIYLFGGIHDIIYELNDAHLFDTASNQWEIIEDSTQHLEIHDKNNQTQNLNESSISKSKNQSPCKTRENLSHIKLNEKKIEKLMNINYSINEAEELEKATPANIQEEKKKKIKQQQKQEMLKQFEISKEEVEGLQIRDPLTESLKNSILAISNASFNNKNKKKINESTYIQVQYDPCKKPCPRDGHSAQIIENQLIIFGGDRHKMSFNDLYCVQIDTWKEKAAQH